MTINSAFTSVQPARVSAKLSTSRSPFKKLLDILDTDKSSEPDDTGLHPESQVGRGSVMPCHLKPFQFAIVEVILVESEIKVL